MAGILGNLFRDDPGYAGAPQGGILGGGGAYGPMAGNQKAALFFAGLRDAVNSFSGGGPTDFAGQQGQQFYRQNAMSQRDAVRKKIQDAAASGDPQALRAAVMEAASVDPQLANSIMQATKFGQPQYEQVDPTRDTYSVDPITGERKLSSKGVQKATPNQPFNPDGTPNTAYQEYEMKLRQQGRDAGLGTDALFSMIDTPQGMYGVTRGGIPKPMTGPDGKPLISYHSDPSLRFDLGAAGKAGAAAGAAAEAWPATEANFQNVGSVINRFFDPKVRAQAPKAIGYGSVLPTIPGENSDFRAQQGQLKGAAFLDAFNALRGGGAISEKEGEKAEASRLRAINANTPEEFYAALTDFSQAVGRSHAAAKVRAQRGQVVPQLGQMPKKPTVSNW